MIHYDTLGNCSNLYYHILQRCHLYQMCQVSYANAWSEVCQPPRTPGQDLKRWSYDILQLHRSWTKRALKASNLHNFCTSSQELCGSDHSVGPNFVLEKKTPGEFSACHAPVGTCAPTSTWEAMPTTSDSDWSHSERKYKKQSKPSETTLFVITPFPFWPPVAITFKQHVHVHVLWQQLCSWHLIAYALMSEESLPHYNAKLHVRTDK